MELYQDLLIQLLKEHEMQVSFPTMNVDPEKWMKDQCYRALQSIQFILKDPTLEDEDCFQRIEAIVEVFEAMGSDCGTRHDSM